jgi:hypothetical protein
MEPLYFNKGKLAFHKQPLVKDSPIELKDLVDEDVFEFCCGFFTNWLDSETLVLRQDCFRKKQHSLTTEFIYGGY